MGNASFTRGNLSAVFAGTETNEKKISKDLYQVFLGNIGTEFEIHVEHTDSVIPVKIVFHGSTKDGQPLAVPPGFNIVDQALQHIAIELGIDD